MRHYFRFNFLKIALLSILVTIFLYVHAIAKPSDIQTGTNTSSRVSMSTTSNKYVDTSLWPYLNPDSSMVASAADSIKARAIIGEIAPDLRAFLRINEDLRKRKISSDEADQRRYPICKRIRPKLERVIRLNPFYRTAKNWLQVVYSILEKQFHTQKNWKEYIPIASNFLQILPEKNRYFFYGRIANVYYQLNESKLALDSYQSAITSLFDNYEDSLYTTNQKYMLPLLTYLTRRAQLQEKLYFIDAALISYNNLLLITQDDRQKEAIRRRIKRLQWDDRNINATQKREEAFSLYGEKKYEQAHTLFSELYDSLRTNAARDEINWWLARIEYINLKQRYQGLERMWKIIKKTPLDSTGMPIDSTYRRYLNTYAQMCLWQGVEEFNLEHFRSAFIYFSKASEIEGEHQARCFYYLAYLVSLDYKSVQHAQRTIEYGQKAWALRNDLNESEKKFLAQRISFAYKQSGDFDAALDWYKIYHNLNKTS